MTPEQRLTKLEAQQVLTGDGHQQHDRGLVRYPPWLQGTERVAWIREHYLCPCGVIPCPRMVWAEIDQPEESRQSMEAVVAELSSMAKRVKACGEEIKTHPDTCLCARCLACQQARTQLEALGLRLQERLGY